MFERYCPYCAYSTEKASTLSMHISMKHKKSKKHKCPECDQSFAQKTQLEHHFVNQHCEADIECPHPDCTLKFKTTANQKSHYVRNHLNHLSLFSTCIPKTMKQCKRCGHQAKTAAMYYHVAHCSPCSPFSEAYKESAETSSNDDDDDDHDYDDDSLLDFDELDLSNEELMDFVMSDDLQYRSMDIETNCNEYDIERELDILAEQDDINMDFW